MDRRKKYKVRFLPLWPDQLEFSGAHLKQVPTVILTTAFIHTRWELVGVLLFSVPVLATVEKLVGWPLACIVYLVCGVAGRLGCLMVFMARYGEAAMFEPLTGLLPHAVGMSAFLLAAAPSFILWTPFSFAPWLLYLFMCGIPIARRYQQEPSAWGLFVLLGALLTFWNLFVGLPIMTSEGWLICYLVQSVLWDVYAWRVFAQRRVMLQELVELAFAILAG